MKAYWDDQKHRLVFDLEGAKIRGDFTKHSINENPPFITNMQIFNTGTIVKGQLDIKDKESK